MAADRPLLASRGSLTAKRHASAWVTSTGLDRLREMAEAR